MSIDDEREALAELRDAREERAIACPHWAPGRITLRKGCTACQAEAARDAS